jgi:hypothetical protein
MDPRSVVRRRVAADPSSFSPSFPFCFLATASPKSVIAPSVLLKWIDCSGSNVSIVAVVWSIPCCFPNSYDGFVPVVRWLYDRLLSHLCFSSFLFDRRPKRSASQPPTALELEAASGYVLLLLSFVFVLRVLSIRYSTSDHFSNSCFYLFSSTLKVLHSCSRFSTPKLLRTCPSTRRSPSNTCRSTRPKLHSCRRLSTTKLLRLCRTPSSTTAMATLRSSLSDWITRLLVFCGDLFRG